MVYNEGDTVVVKKSLGKENGRIAGEYYFGLSIKEIPLGSRGVVLQKLSDNSYRVQVRDRKLYFDERELKSGEKEGSECSDSSLEKALLSSCEETLPSELEEKNLTPVEAESGRNLPGMLTQILRYFTNPFYSDLKAGSFEPKFNAREEFAVWLRQQFPDLPSSKAFSRYDYSSSRGVGHIEYSGSYHFPENKTEEIKKAAKEACEHGIKTAEGCISAYFKNCKDRLDNDFDNAVFCLINLIENVSVNLPHEKKHYGTEVRR